MLLFLEVRIMVRRPPAKIQTKKVMGTTGASRKTKMAAIGGEALDMAQLTFFLWEIKWNFFFLA